MNNLKDEIKKIERELLDFKQVQGGVANVSSYLYETTLDFYNPFTHSTPVYEVEFEAEPVIVSYVADAFTAIPMKKVGNKQYLMAGFIGGKVYIISSQKVISITKIT